MKYNVLLNLPQGWEVTTENVTDEAGEQIVHVEARLLQEGKECLVDIQVGAIPQEMNAMEQALSNYADMVGFDDDDPDDFEPVGTFRFNGRNAYGFTALCEDDSPMMLLTQEVRSGVLAVICAVAPSDPALEDLMVLVEKSFRLK